MISGVEEEEEAVVVVEVMLVVGEEEVAVVAVAIIKMLAAILVRIWTINNNLNILDMGIGNVIQITGMLEDIKEVAVEEATEEVEIIEIPTRAIIRITVKVLVKIMAKVTTKVLVKIMAKVPVKITVKVTVKIINNHNILVKEILTEVTIVAVETIIRIEGKVAEEEAEEVAEVTEFKEDGIRVATILATTISEVAITEAEAEAVNIEAITAKAYHKLI